MVLASYRPKSREDIARNMSAIRSSENRTEAALRRAIHGKGIRYRAYQRKLLGSPDIVFRSARVVVFVDGDYWHERYLIQHGRAALRKKLARLSPESRKYWLDKFTRRVVRDRELTRVLRQDGWMVLRFWESDVKRAIDSYAHRVVRRVLARRQALSKLPKR
jgi:DNA mismatch endonuclease (patch repair protein)